MRPACPRGLFYALFRLKSGNYPPVLLPSSSRRGAKNPGVNTLILSNSASFPLFPAPIYCQLPASLLIPALDHPDSLLIYQFLPAILHLFLSIPDKKCQKSRGLYRQTITAPASVSGAIIFDYKISLQAALRCTFSEPVPGLLIPTDCSE